MFESSLHRDNDDKYWEGITMEEWISALKLSTMWEFSDVRKKAIQNMQLPRSEMDPVTMVLLAQEYMIPEWLLPGYEQLIKRPEFISMDEAERLGLRTVMRLYKIREETMYTRRSGLCDCERGIRRDFAEELKEVGVAELANSEEPEYAASQAEIVRLANFDFY